MKRRSCGSPSSTASFARYRRDIPPNVHPALRGWSPTGAQFATEINLNLLLRESVAFPSRRTSPGLQLADIVAGTFTRAMNQQLNAGISGACSVR